ncbi:LysE family transporter [Constrictibacter sp. MBR-5]|uniref:LysE family translocator n=1 Tax=Constrictibacter sp. MBR-5 TaxID=3156467 RepID=UPI0033983A9B
MPGPDFIAVVRSAMTRGSRAGLLTALGVSCGLALYATLSLLGLSVVLAQYQWLAWAVRIVGGAYLIYLGIRLLTAPARPVDLAEAGTAPPGRALVFGFVVTLTNPKAIVLFASVFATATTAQTPVWLMAVMAGLVFLSSLLWYTAVALFMSSPPVMRRVRDARHLIERAAGLCFVLIGGRIVAGARSL